MVTITEDYRSAFGADTHEKPQEMSPAAYVLIGALALVLSVSAAFVTGTEYPGIFDECCAAVAADVDTEFASRPNPNIQ